MKSAIRKSLSVLLTLTMVLSLFGGLTFTAFADPIPIGNNVNCTIDYDTGEAVITGTGETWRIVSGMAHDVEYDSPFVGDRYNSDLIKNVTVGEGVTSIADGLFYQCRALSYSLPETLTSIGEEAFYSTKVKELTLPSSLRSIGDAAFQTSDLTSITIPEGVTSIGTVAFQRCLSLQKAAIPGSAAAIPAHCFSGCYALKEVYIGSGVETVDANAFLETGPLTVYYGGSAADWAAVSIDPTGNDALLNATVYCNTPTPVELHAYGDPVWSWEKCHGKATATFTCTGCGDEQTVTDNAPVFENGQFTATVEFEGATYTDTVSLGTGDLVEFGAYPQTLVTDETLKAELNSQTLNWTSYKYFFNGAQDDFMEYADVTVDGNEYRAVRFDHYRPYYTTNASTDADNARQDENNYSPDTVYWFEYEPIVWRILDADAGLMLTESIVDSQPFCNGFYYSGGEYYGDADHTHYASDWADSSLREWLNGDFLNAAFDSGAQSHIKNTSLVTPSSGSSVYDAGPTTDKIFVLSKDDALNPAYGFSSDSIGSASANRTAFGTDYAKCQGLLVEDSPGDYFSGASWWRLRSPYLSYGAGDVGLDGHVDDNIGTDYTDDGVRPAVKINLQSAIAQSAVRIHHDCGGLIPEVPATCTENGAIDHYVCSLCGRYLDADRNPVDDIEIPAAGHTYGDTGDDRFTCTVCGHVDDALKAAAELADAKEAAKEALATYKNASDYRPAQQGELDAAIAAGNGEIEAATDIDAVNAALAAAKANIDAIKTDAQLTAEEAAAQLAADKAAFEDYKAEQKAAAQAMAEEGDSAASAQLIADAVAAVEAMAYSDARTLEQNKALVDTVLAKLADDLTAQREAETPVIPVKTKECPICGKVHNGNLFDVLLGEFHWWLNVLQKILRSFG